MRHRERIEIRSERGQTMTEFAIVLPVLAMVLFGIIQMGIVWNNYVSVTDAARAGARKASVNRLTDPTGKGCSAARASAATLVQANMTCNVSIVGPLDRPGADVTVRITYPYSINLLGVAVKSGSLVSETTERME